MSLGSSKPNGDLRGQRSFEARAGEPPASAHLDHAESVDDMPLLREYVERGSDPAFAPLVSRHMGHVYSTAFRQTTDAHLAEEITQAVFIILARKAPTIRPGTILGGWLFPTTPFASSAPLNLERGGGRSERNPAAMVARPHQAETQTTSARI